MRALLALAILAATLVAVPRDAAAAGWCVFYDAYTYNCGFISFQQCQATAFGGGGLCRPDPAATSKDSRDDRRPRVRRSRDRDER